MSRLTLLRRSIWSLASLFGDPAGAGAGAGAVEPAGLVARTRVTGAPAVVSGAPSDPAGAGPPSPAAPSPERAARSGGSSGGGDRRRSCRP